MKSAATRYGNISKTDMEKEPTILRRLISDLIKKYFELEFAQRRFKPGETLVPVSGRVFDESELQYLVESSLDFWLTTGRFADEFETKLAEYIGVKHALLVNSGSSANLIAVSALTSPKLGGRRLKPGDEVITVAAGFPTTVNPIIQNNLVPVFVDVSIPTYNADPDLIENAIGEKTRAIILAHTLGNPFDLDRIVKIANKHDLWLVEDCCDALGAVYEGKRVGSFGHIATFSFYPAHHITMGEGGCVATNDHALKIILQSFRDWGRDCWCETGHDNACGKRFDRQYEELPAGYDHKYVYSHIGYNLKVTDMQAAIGVAQLRKLQGFLEIRKMNFDYIVQGLKKFDRYLIMPQATERAEPAWFGVPITVSEQANFSRNDLLKFLDSRKIASRLLFGGNLTKQPAYKETKYRISGSLLNTDFIMNSTFWIGNYPGLTCEMLDYVISQFGAFIRDKST